MAATINQITATVEATNEKGVKVNGDWVNFSKFVKPDAIEIASRGDLVALELDGKGFIRRLQIVKADMSDVASLPDDAEPSSSEDSAVDADASAKPYREPSKDMLIVRQLSAKVAFSFAESRSDMRAEHAMKLAEMIESWIKRGNDAATA